MTESSPLKGQLVLVVDDEAPIRHLIARILDRAGYACVAAETPAGALQLAETEDPQLVMCDLNMPGGSGLDLVRELRERHPDIAVLMVSGTDDPRTASLAVDLGAYGYVVKPFQANAIVIAAENALRRRQLEIDNRDHREQLERLVAERTADLARVDKLERLQRTLLSHMSGGVVMQDSTGAVVAANPSALRLLGLTNDQLSGQTAIPPDWQAVRPDGTVWPVEHLPGFVALRTGTDQPTELVGVQPPGGDLRWLQANSTTARDETGQPTFVVSSFTDVTADQLARVEADRERQQRRRLLEEVIAGRQLRMVFQPIVDLGSGHVIGVEALARFPGLPERPPNVWFAEAAELGLGTELELAAIEIALAHLPLLPEDTYLSLNVSPSTVGAPRLTDLLTSATPGQLVLELTEHSNIGADAYGPLANQLAPLRVAGVRVAVDDAGAGYASLRHILNLAPDIIKLDIALTSGIDTDPVRRALATALLNFRTDIGAVVVAEGIETHGEMETLKALGLRYGQGYYLGYPQDLPIARVAPGTTRELVPTR